MKLAIMCNIYNFEVPVDDEAKKLPKLFFIDMNLSDDKKVNIVNAVGAFRVNHRIIFKRGHSNEDLR